MIMVFHVSLMTLIFHQENRNIFLELLAINMADSQATGSACKTFGGVIKE